LASIRHENMRTRFNEDWLYLDVNIAEEPFKVAVWKHAFVKFFKFVC
jgi:hypothetical protein